MPVPNLDEMSLDDLFRFSLNRVSGYARRALGEQLFPDRPRGFCTVTHSLCDYARWRVEMFDARRRGNEDSARVFEQTCEAIKNGLPEWARW